MTNPKFLSILLVPILFLIIGIATLSHYGISWDEQFHFNRGQAYLHYFLTGKKDFLDLPAYPSLNGTHDFVDRAGESELYRVAAKSKELPGSQYRRSYYQSDVFNASMLIRGFDGGHPPTSDILAALTNYIFYQKLGLLGDIEAYHSYEIFVSSLLVLGVAIFVYYNFGALPASFAALSLALYPLFFAESHFNIKDPTQASFFGLTLISFYFGVVKKNWKFITASSVLAGLALGTKFNAIFLPLVILPWLMFYFVSEKTKVTQFFSKGLVLSFVSFPVIMIGLLFSFWPFLWQVPVGNFLKVVRYYQTIGVGIGARLQDYLAGGWNTYPTLWIFYTTPVVILTLSITGIVVSFYLVFKKNNAAALVLLWLLVTVGRVSWPGTNIYGGVRQIMEYVPALAILAGMGTFWVLQQVPKNLKNVTTVTLLLLFAFTLWELIKIHPNENVYFNQIAGSLSGAVQKNIPSWGNNYGNAYFQGVEWLNKNAEPDAKLGLPVANMVNVPRIKLRPDIYFSNSYPSGPARQGEYIMEMSHDWEPKKWYGFAYYDKFLEPVHEIKVDDVPILKIWKNDIKHTRLGFEKEMEERVASLEIENSRLLIDIGQEVILTRLVVSHGKESCDSKQVGGYIRLSTDGKTWVQEPESIDYPQIPIGWLGSDDDTSVFMFAAKRARFLFLDTENASSCILNTPAVRIFALVKS